MNQGTIYQIMPLALPNNLLFHNCVIWPLSALFSIFPKNMFSFFSPIVFLLQSLTQALCDRDCLLTTKLIFTFLLGIYLYQISLPPLLTVGALRMRTGQWNAREVAWATHGYNLLRVLKSLLHALSYNQGTRMMIYRLTLEVKVNCIKAAISDTSLDFW